MIATTVRTCFPVAARVVADKADEINRLNVFPVPDGDTGTNMSLTLQTVVGEIEALPEGASMADIAQAITHGSLMGARGNSGVITSQILRGVAEGLTQAKGRDATVADIASALRNGVRVAFKAVRKPVEGTILTVLKDVSARADELERSRGITVVALLDALVVEAYESVARTPDLLPVLKENGVVDSGAFGLATFIEAFVNAYEGKAGEVSDFATTAVRTADGAKAAVANVVDIEINDDWEGSEYRYCTEFLFHAESAAFDEEAALRYLSSMGDCELLVGANPDYKIHVHTNRPDRVLRHMLHRGQIFNVFVHNMDLEAQERTEDVRAHRDAASSEDESAGHADVAAARGDEASEPVQVDPSVREGRRPVPETAAPLPHKELGFVAVAAGSGQAEILRSLGVDVVVLGGQTMNPSTADILSAIERANADAVIVLPNNGNIRMAAEAAAQEAACQAVVIPTRSVLQAFSAMFAVDREASLADNVGEMTLALSAVRDGEVTRAVRDSVAADGSPIHTGDVMGIEGSDITVVGTDVRSVTVSLINRMQEAEEGDTCTILAGADLDDDAFSALLAAIEKEQPYLELDAHRGEQPLYPVVFSIE